MTTASATRASAAGAELTAPERPAEAVEICELLYRGMFSAGLIVVAAMSAYAAALSLVRPEDNAVRGAVVSLVLLGLAGLAFAGRERLYGKLRRHPWGILLVGATVGLGAWIIGDPNDQIFYVAILALGVMSLTVRFPWMLAGASLAALGCTAPALLSASPHVTSTAIAAVMTPMIFWLIIERLARYILRAYGESTVSSGGRAASGAPAGGAGPGSTGGEGASDASEAAEDFGPPAEDASGARQRRLGGRRQRTLPGPAGPRRRAARRTLSARQMEVVLLRAEGLTDAEIGACLEIGPQQVRRHLREARERTASPTTAALMAWAVGHGLIPGR